MSVNRAPDEEREGDVMVLIGIAVLLLASTALVIGMLQSAMPVVYLSIASSAVVGMVLALSVMRGRSSAEGGAGSANQADEPPSPPTQPTPAPSIDPDVAVATNGSRTVELKAPGAEPLGRLRRRPLAERDIPGRSPTPPEEGSQPRKPKPSGPNRSGASRSRSTSTATSTKPKARSASASPNRVRAAPREPTARKAPANRAKATTKRAPRPTAPPARQAGRGGGTAPAKRPRATPKSDPS